MTVKGRSLSFSHWPMFRTIRRYGLHSQVYANNPWAIIESSVRARCPLTGKDEALATLTQARHFYDAAVQASDWEAKPLPLYYAFMNLAKSYSLTKGIRQTFDQAQHGLSERLTPLGVELTDAFLEAFPNSPGARPNIFASFKEAVSGSPLIKQTTYTLPALLPQVVAGHRLWCDATGNRERFVSVRAIPLLHDSSTKSV